MIFPRNFIYVLTYDISLYKDLTIYIIVPVKYPDTSLENVITVYNITGWKNLNNVFLDVNIYLL